MGRGIDLLDPTLSAPLNLKRQSLIIKLEFFMLPIRWDFKEITHFKLLLIVSNITINQLDKLNDSLIEKQSELINRKGKVHHQDMMNTKRHTSLST